MLILFLKLSSNKDQINDFMDLRIRKNIITLLFPVDKNPFYQDDQKLPCQDLNF